jgi:predicted Zn-dependent protease with MMP-like domain
MSREEFETCVQEAFDTLPDGFQRKIDNVQIVVEDYPDEDLRSELKTGKHSLLGLYTGIPLPHRNSWYGTTPTVPDRIFLFQKNIEAQCATREQLQNRIVEVLFHELGHYFGMNEAEVRRALKQYE